jgi:hypothetical protein
MIHVFPFVVLMAVNIEKRLQPSAVGCDVASVAYRFQTVQHHISEDRILHNRYFETIKCTLLKDSTAV